MEGEISVEGKTLYAKNHKENYNKIHFIPTLSGVLKYNLEFKVYYTTLYSVLNV